MNDRKQHVISKAHQLFIDKGYQNTSIQDILDYSGISKGTFYNYFSSKNELLIAIFKTIFEKVERERQELLVGQDPSDIDVFTKQIELQMRSNKKNNLFALFEEVFVSHDDELKEFLKKGHLRALKWVYHRFIDLFGEAKKPYLLDCAIMFWAILNQNLRYQSYETNASIHKVVSFTVGRIVKMVEDLSETGDQLHPPELLKNWLPEEEKKDRVLQEEIKQSVLSLVKTLKDHDELSKYTELLLFIEDELFHSNPPRKFVVECALSSLKAEKGLKADPTLLKLEKDIHEFFHN